jgi:hypothetical protein
LKGYLFVTPGDITQFSAHAVAFSASSHLNCDGNLYSAFAANVPGFTEWYDALGDNTELPAKLGDTYWMPLPPDRHPHGVVVAVSTGRGVPQDDKAAVAVRAALTTAVDELRKAGVKDRLLIAPPAFRLGMGGDRGQRLRSAVVQITAASQFLEQTQDVDVAFVTYTITLYRIFLEARRQVLGKSPAERNPATCSAGSEQLEVFLLQTCYGSIHNSHLTRGFCVFAALISARGYSHGLFSTASDQQDNHQTDSKESHRRAGWPNPTPLGAPRGPVNSQHADPGHQPARSSVRWRPWLNLHDDLHGALGPLRCSG